jgi:ATP diphosphatase
LARSDSLQRRAASAGFDWPDLSGVIAKVHEEIAEVLAEGADRTHEIGDLLFSVVNLARRLEVDPEQALRRAADRFDRRFRVVEASGDLASMSLEEMDQEWERAKGEE